jgi:hypothetical protein
VTDWIASIEAAAQTWSNVSPSNFSFVRQVGSSNTVRYEVPNPPTILAGSPYPPGGYIVSGYTKINPTYIWDINNTPLPSDPNHNGSTISYNLQNVVTHELGHWLFLDDIDNTGCVNVTMKRTIGHGEIMKISLDANDKSAVNWQYP